MEILYILGAIYLCIGFIYAMYILLFAGDRWYWFPINMVGGPLVMLYLLFMTLTGKDIN